MTGKQQDPIKEHETMTVNYCEVCKTRYTREEAEKKHQQCCGKPLQKVEERVPMPFGP